MPWLSHQRSIFQRQKPASPRKMIFTPGHVWRRRVTRSFNIAQACRATSMLLGRRSLTRAARRKKRRAAGSTNRRSIRGKSGLPASRGRLARPPASLFPSAASAIVGRVEIEDQLGRRRLETRDELLDEHPRHGHGRARIGTVLQPAQGRAAGQLLAALERALPGQNPCAGCHGR